MVDDETLIALTADIVCAHVSNNSVSTNDVATLIHNVHAALSGLTNPVAPSEEARVVPAVSIRASIKPDRLISMIDGKPYKMLKRHLARHGHTAESYRETYGLPNDYPMVAREYAEQRRGLALQIGLGRKGKEKGAPQVKN